MPKSSNKEIMEFKRLVREVMKKKSVSKSPLSRELEKRKKSSVRTSVRSVKRGKRKARKSQKQQAGAVRDGSHQRFPRCR